jgi:hypothetical protein
MKKLPFKEIFKLYKAEMPIQKIAKEVGIPAPTITKVIYGHWMVPLDQIEAVKESGFKLCSCCRRRIVPVHPVEGVSLTRLCLICYKRGDGEKIYSIDYSLNNF